MKELKNIIENILNSEKNEYAYYGLRAHHNMDSKVGEFVDHNSSNWCVEQDLDGVCAVDVLGMCQRNEDKGIDDVEEIYEDIMESANIYLDGGEIILIGADEMEYGEDDDEIVIDGKRLA